MSDNPKIYVADKETLDKVYAILRRPVSASSTSGLTGTTSP